MNDTQGIPAAPSDRDLPNQRRTREELLMKIGSRKHEASSHRRWGVPLAVAAGVTAVSVAAVVVLGEADGGRPDTADPAGATRTTPAPSATGEGTADGASPEDAFTVTGAGTTPIDSASVTRILSSCLGPDASQYRAAVAARTPVATKDWDGVVVAVNSSGQYVQCQSKGDKGMSQDTPPTFINDRLWGTGRSIEYFDSVLGPVGKGTYLALGAGHYASGVAKVTVSYGNDPKEYPARMADGAFVYAAALRPDTPPGPRYTGPTPYVHAYDAHGKEIYNQAEDPKFTDGE